MVYNWRNEAKKRGFPIPETLINNETLWPFIDEASKWNDDGESEELMFKYFIDEVKNFLTPK